MVIIIPVIYRVAGLATGIAIGVSLPKAYEALYPPYEDDPYLFEVRQRVQLLPEQLRALRTILEYKKRDTMAVYSNLRDQLPALVRREIEKVNRLTQERIEAVLDRAQWDSLQKAQRVVADGRQLPRKK